MNLNTHFHEPWALLLDHLVSLGFEDETITPNPLFTRSFDLTYLSCDKNYYDQRVSWKIQLCFFDNDAAASRQYTYRYWVWLDLSTQRPRVILNGTQSQGTDFQGSCPLTLPELKVLMQQVHQANEQYNQKTNAGQYVKPSSISAAYFTRCPPSIHLANALSQLYNTYGLTTITRATTQILEVLQPISPTSVDQENVHLTEYENILINPPSDFQPYVDKVNELSEDLAGLIAQSQFEEIQKVLSVKHLNTVLFRWFIRASGQGLMLYAAVCYQHQIPFPHKALLNNDTALQFIQDEQLQQKYPIADTIEEINLSNWQHYAQQHPVLHQISTITKRTIIQRTSLTCLHAYMAALVQIEGP